MTLTEDHARIECVGQQRQVQVQWWADRWPNTTAVVHQMFVYKNPYSKYISACVEEENGRGLWTHARRIFVLKSSTKLTTTHWY